MKNIYVEEELKNISEVSFENVIENGFPITDDEINDWVKGITLEFPLPEEKEESEEGWEYIRSVDVFEQYFKNILEIFNIPLSPFCGYGELFEVISVIESFRESFVSVMKEDENLLTQCWYGKVVGKDNPTEEIGFMVECGFYGENSTLYRFYNHDGSLLSLEITYGIMCEFIKTKKVPYGHFDCLLIDDNGNEVAL